jgi:hypothetical protein
MDALHSELDTVALQYPPVFKDALVTSGRWKGQARAYTVAPAEQVQRISTNARSATSVEAALAIAAATTGDVAALNAGIGYLRQSTGKIEALERSPLVVAFAADRPNNQGASFGWALGPELRFDPKKQNLAYRHRIRTHDLLSDLSVPRGGPSSPSLAAPAGAPYGTRRMISVLPNTRVRRPRRVRSTFRCRPMLRAWMP